jgi:predicted transglutaminase-like cysteine proteinase
MTPRTFALSFAIALAVAVVSVPASAGSWMQTGAPAIPPGGFLGFCVKHLQDCRGSAPNAAPAELTQERWRDLWTVQSQVNHELVPREDPTHTWDYSQNGYADCNKFALQKRRDLIEHGWPRESVLLATATTETGEGHLVVIAHTTAGDYVLDNRTTQVVEWSALPYRWISMQSPTSPVRWVSITAAPIAISDASHVINQPTLATP